MASVNQALADDAISHAVDLHQYSNAVVYRIIGLLNRADPDLSEALTAALSRLPESQFSVDRLESLLYSVRALNAAAYAAVSRELTEELQRFVAVEAAHQYELFTTVIPPQVQASIGVAQVNVSQVYAAAMSRPFQGVLLREALTGLEEGRARLIRDQIRIGYINQETTQQIIRRVIGTQARSYTDGEMDRSRRGLEAIVRTAISHTAGTVRDKFFEDNSDLIKAEQWVSTIDLRTSEPCRIRDGLQYTPGEHKPIKHSIPWLAGPGRLHYCCRSSACPITKSWAELGGADLPDFGPKERASMDGTVPAKVTYPDWLQRQSAARQDEVLGPTRGALLRRGGLKVADMYDLKGRYLSLEELKQRSAQAFTKAGI